MSAAADITSGFLAKADAACSRLRCSLLDLLGVAFSESGLRAAAHNPNGDAVGLIQFMPNTLRNLGWLGDWRAFAALTPDAQLPYVERYLSPYAGRIDSVTAVYTAVFLPALLDAVRAGGPGFVLAARGGPLGWAYEANAVFDADRDLAIEAHELADAVARNCHGPRWDDVCARARAELGLEPAPPTPTPEMFDLRTVLGIQQALTALGLDAGPCDGFGGPRTRAGVRAFQAAHPPLAVDCVPGPATRAALQAALAALADTEPPAQAPGA